MRIVADLFESGGVDVVFSSYIHVYQRSKPLRFKPATMAQVYPIVLSKSCNTCR